MPFKRFHYAFVVTAVTFAALLVAAAVRSAPGLLIVPFEGEFGWDRASISLAVAISLITFGLAGPLGGTLIDRFGPKRVILGGMLLILAGLFALDASTQLWQLYLVWGVLIGVGTGAVSGVLGATVAYRWFRSHRGVVVGAFGAATSAGQLVFIPAMATRIEGEGWRDAIGLLIAASIAILLPVLLFMKDRPSDIGKRAYGEGATLSAAEKKEDARGTPMRAVLRTRDFWLLASSFFICGFTSNGLIGTHLIPHAMEHGFTEVAAAGAVGVMGAMNIVGTLASGWLTDRYDNRRLLGVYYGFRALSLVALPFVYDSLGLYAFAVLYGLDWIATVPPTTNLVATIYGRASLGTVYGWIWFGHMMGASTAAYAGGVVHNLLGAYHPIFITAAAMGFIAVALTQQIAPRRALAIELAPPVAPAY